MNKLWRKISVILIAFLIFIPPTWADPAPFHLSISEDNSLLIKTADGRTMITLPLPTIGKRVEIPPVSFELSYGRDIDNHVAVVVTPNPQHLTELSFTVLKQTVEMDKESVVTLLFQNNNSEVSIDPGFVGQVKVDGHLITLPTTATQTKLVTSTVSLVSDLQEQMPDAKFIEARKLKNTSAAGNLPANVFAQKGVYWAEPVTPPDAGQAPVVAVNEMKLVEGKGNVKIGNGWAKDGDVIDAGTKISSGPNSSVAILIGGVNSIRLAPDSVANVSSKVENGKRTTVVELGQGLVFSKVGTREGEIQDFKVKTPYGVAVARGTDFSTMVKPNKTTVIVAQGAVDLVNRDGGFVGTAVSVNRGSVSVVSTSPSTSAEQMRDILTTVATAGQLNDKVNGLLQKQETGSLSAAENTYLQQIAIVNFAFKITPETMELIRQPQLPGPTQTLAALDSSATTAPALDSSPAVSEGAPSVFVSSVPSAIVQVPVPNPLTNFGNFPTSPSVNPINQIDPRTNPDATTPF